MARKIKTLAATTANIEAVEPSFDASALDAALEAVVATIEAAEVQEPEAEAVSETPAVTDFRDLMAEVDDEASARMVDEARAALLEREAFEDRKNPDNANIHRTIKKLRTQLLRSYAGRVMVAAKQDPGFINRTLMDGSCYNVYAVGKYGDLVDALAGSGMSNAINIAITRSLFAFARNGLEFNGEMAKAAASDKIRVADAVKKVLVRHTVSASTAPTQASSTMQALETLGIVRVEGSRKHPTYKLLETPQRYRLQEIVEAMAA